MRSSTGLRRAAMVAILGLSNLFLADLLADTGDAVSLEISVLNDSIGTELPMDAVSREVSVYLQSSLETVDTDAVSREVSVLVGAVPEAPATNAVSREVSVYVVSIVDMNLSNATSCEVSVYQESADDRESRDAVSREVSIYAALPDLSLESVTASEFVIYGENADVSWTVRNIGPGVASGTWVDHVYLSEDTIFDPGDLFVAEIAHTNSLPPNETYQSSASVPAPACETGVYYFIVFVNASAVLNELPLGGANVSAADATQVVVLSDDCNGNGVPDTTDLIESIDFSIVASMQTGGGPGFVAEGDLDMDGDIDLAVVNSSDSTISLFLNNGDGTFTMAAPITVSNGPRAVCIADLDNDGLPDMAVTCFTANSITLLRNQGGGQFVPVAPFVTGNQPFGVAAGDIDGDGFIDLLVGRAEANSPSVCVHRNMGNLVFGSAEAVTVLNGSGNGVRPRSVALADVDGDGDLDIISGNGDANIVGSVSIVRNIGGQFSTSPEVYSVGMFPYDVTLADWNNDGAIDIGVVNASSGSATLLRNNGSGQFTALTTMLTGSAPRRIRALDLNADGWVDVVIANYGSNTVTAYKNEGNGGFMPAYAWDFGQNSGCHGLAIGDFNDDGRSDFAVANLTAATCVVFHNRSTSESDCNENGILDECDVRCGSSLDLDENGIPDECQVPGNCTSCPGDLTGDHVRDGQDIQAFVDCMIGESIAEGCGCADMVADGSLSLDDIAEFTARLLVDHVCE
ncbi:MAG: VCBS repeat-containing protein [Phycisphaerae bacterium]|nr:VCBS repeat-containing protein [Phycisphaerae bacterium]